MLSKKLAFDLIKAFGTPLYVIDEQVLSDALKSIDTAFHHFPSPVLVAYPYKTNSIREVCSFMRDHGRLAEVASRLELDMALSLGILPDSIIYNGPYKSTEDIKFALSLGCRLHIDNFPELETVFAIANQIETNKPIEVGLRLSTHTSFGWDRFGFDIDNGESNLAITKLLSSNVRLVSFHTHQSNIGTISEYGQHQSRIIRYIASAINTFQLDLKYVDLGSGFALQWPKPKYKKDWNAPRLSEYVDTLASLWNNVGFPENLYLVIEPGRIAVSPAGLLLTRVTNTKLRMDKKIVSVDSGHNLVAGAELFEYKIRYLGRKNTPVSKKKEHYEVYGILCDSLDLLGSNVALPETNIGDILIFNDIGGYDISRSFSWQIPRPAVIWLGEAKYKMIRFPENKEYQWLLNQPL